LLSSFVSESTDVEAKEPIFRGVSVGERRFVVFVVFIDAVGDGGRGGVGKCSAR
jgi:hypothetical protein